MKPGSRPNARRSLGAFGERQAAAFLDSQGYAVVARNWRCARGEIDIVARHQDTIVFVEVRTRRGSSFGSPEESLTARKRARLAQLAHTYLAAQPAPLADWRIDLVAVLVGVHNRIERISHLVNIVEE